MLWNRNISCVATFLGIILLHSVDAGQIRVIDDQGHEVTLSAPAQRIVSLAPSITETLFAIGAGNHVIGVTDYCTFPPEATLHERVGGIINPNIETIVSLKPDVIVMSMEGNTKQGYENLLRFNVPLFVTNPRTLAGIYRSIEQLGMITGRTAAAATLARSLQYRADSLSAVLTNITPRSVLLFVSTQPLIVVGNGTFLHQLVELAGGVNVAAKARGTYPQYSRESVLKDNPNVLIFLSDIVQSPMELLTLYPEWRTLTAFRKQRVFTIDADIVSRPGPRTVDAIDQLFQLIHKRH